MPSKLKCTKKFISVGVDRELLYKLQQTAADTGLSTSALVRNIFENAMKNVTLTEELKEKAHNEAEEVRKTRTWSRRG